jgi:Fe-S-cluster containining protein
MELPSPCLGCGLCCDGSLYGGLLVTEVERAQLVRRLPIFQAQIVATEKGPRLLQPCAAYQGQCGVYEDRPSPCRAYRCTSLIAFESAEITLDEIENRITKVRALQSSLRARLGADADRNGRLHADTLWRMLKAHQAVVHSMRRLSNATAMGRCSWISLN